MIFKRALSILANQQRTATTEHAAKLMIAIIGCLRDGNPSATDQVLAQPLIRFMSDARTCMRFGLYGIRTGASERLASVLHELGLPEQAGGEGADQFIDPSEAPPAFHREFEAASRFARQAIEQAIQASHRTHTPAS